MRPSRIVAARDALASSSARLAAALLAIACLWPPACGAVPEYELKAALIYKIGKFVRWPEGALAQAGGTLLICIIGRDDFGTSLDTLSGQHLQGQVIAVQRIASGEQRGTECQIAFISRSEQNNLAVRLAALSKYPVLTISDIAGFAGQGGMIGFSTTDSKINFQINAGASRRAGLEIGSQLLQFASLIGDDPGVKP